MIREFIENERKRLRKLSNLEITGEARFKNEEDEAIMTFETILCEIGVPYQKIELNKETIFILK